MPLSFLTRRRTLWLGLGAVLGIGAAVRAKANYRHHQLQSQVQSLAHRDRSFALDGNMSLGERAAAKRLIYGAAARRANLESDSALAVQYGRECKMLIPEWELKWSAGSSHLRPTSDTFDFTDADWMLDFAQTHNLLIRGHTLVWHLSLPSWFQDAVNRQNAEQFLVNHIKTVAGRYAGKMHSWDVVNEAIEPGDGRPDNLRVTPWLEFLGADYIEMAFRVAAKADPRALLVYNDYGLEYDTPEHEAKRTAVLKLLEQLKTKGTPIGGFGIQSHLVAQETRFNPQKLRRFLADVASLGLKILVTELDVVDQELPAEVSTRDRIVAAAYEDYLSVVLEEPAVIAVLTWGLSDRYTWLSEYAPRVDRTPVRTLPLDENLQPKLAWNAMARAFDRASARQTV